MHKGITHLTVTTGHTRLSPRDEVADTAIANLRKSMLRDWPPPEGRELRVQLPEPLQSYSVASRPQGDQHHAIVAMSSPWVMSGTRSPVTFGIAWSERHARRCWDAIVDLHPKDLPLPGRPVAPWIAVHLDLDLLDEDLYMAYWAGDFERCLAWAIAPLDS